MADFPYVTERDVKKFALWNERRREVTQRVDWSGRMGKGRNINNENSMPCA
jgi:hypothetical protein